MGRAAGTNRVDRGNRTGTTVNPWTGQPQAFVVRASDEALVELAHALVQLGSQGVPDPPRDLDTSAWTLDPDSAAEAAVYHAMCEDPITRSLGHWAVMDGRMFLKANLLQAPDHGLILGVLAGPRGGLKRGFIRVPSFGAATETVADIAAKLCLSKPPFVIIDKVLADIALSSGKAVVN